MEQNNWTVFDLNNPPPTGTNCWYYFEITGVSYGKYIGHNTFGGRHGFLCGDVTHYMICDDESIVPDPPCL